MFILCPVSAASCTHLFSLIQYPVYTEYVKPNGQLYIVKIYYIYTLSPHTAVSAKLPIYYIVIEAQLPYSTIIYTPFLSYRLHKVKLFFPQAKTLVLIPTPGHLTGHEGLCDYIRLIDKHVFLHVSLLFDK